MAETARELGRKIFRLYSSRGIARIGLHSKMERCAVDLVCFEKKTCQPGRMVDAAYQKPRSKGVQCSCMTDFQGFQSPLDPIDDSGRGYAIGFVDQQYSRADVCDRLAHISSARPIIFVLISGSVDPMLKPAALECPPPPKAAAMAATSTDPSDRRLT